MRLLSTILLLATIPPPGAFAGVQDGLLDGSFAGDGIVAWTAGAANSIELEDAVATADGTLIGVGVFTAGTAPPTLHFQAWGPSGTLSPHACYGPSPDLFPLSTESRGRTAIADSTGNLLVGGSANFLGSEAQPRALLARFALDENGCVLDTTFSANGWEVFDDSDYCADGCSIVDLAEIAPATGAVTAPRVVALLKSGGFFGAQLVLVGLRPSGALDSDFGAGGLRLLAGSALGSVYPTGTAHLAIDPRGRIYVFATHHDPEDTSHLHPFLFRLSADGVPDFSFGTGGILSMASGEQAQDIDVRSDGSLVIDVKDFTPDIDQLCVGRPPALQCTTFSIVDVRTTLAQGDGKVLFGFENTVADGIQIRRSTGQLGNDETFGNGNPQVDLDLGGSNDETLVEMLLASGRPVLAGTATATPDRTAGFLARLTNSYIFADGFEGGTPASWSALAP